MINIFTTTVKKCQGINIIPYIAIDPEWDGGRAYGYSEYHPGTYKTFAESIISYDQIALLASNHIIKNPSKHDGLLDILSKRDKPQHIIISDINFLRYIKDNFPKLITIKSITSWSNSLTWDSDPKEGIDEFDMICPKPSYVSDEMIGEVGADRIELIVNDICYHGCKIYNDHFSKISSFNRGEILNATPDEVQDCIYCRINQNQTQDKTYDELKHYYDIGIRNFKVSYRSDDIDITQQIRDLTRIAHLRLNDITE